jgi:phage-related protein
MPNSVTLTFAGEEKPLVESMDRVGSAADNMGDRVGSASKHISDSSGEAADGFGKTGEAADKAESNLIGVHDVIDGTATIMKGPGKDGIVAYIQGWADLAGGLAPLLLSLAETKVATLAQAAAQKVAAAASKVWAGAQWLMNTALLASPITWIIIGIVALVAAIVLIATKTDWFQRAWRAAWGWIKDAASNTWDFIKKIPGWISSAFSNIARVISAPYRAAFNLISDAWNSTIGRLSWTVPGWVPFLGGKTISVPNLPHFHAGGRVPGGPGQEMMAVLQGGETVSTEASSAGGGGGYVVPDGPLIRMVVDLIATEVRKRGGRPEHIGLKPA